jgi:RNA polymerase sigma-70 factor (ECF subfamily)
MLNAGIPGDRDGFRRLYETHGAALYRLLYRLSRSAHDAEDLLQETLTTVWRKRDQFRGEGSLEGWLKRVAYRTYLNARPRLSRSRRLAVLEDAAPAPGAPPDAVVAESEARDDLAARLRRAVDQMPASRREAFLLFRYEGLSCAEVARVLGTTPKAVELRVAKATRALSERFADLRNGSGRAGKAVGS